MDIINILLGEKSKTNYTYLKNNFKLPIQYQLDYKKIDDNLLLDLELESFKNLDMSKNNNYDEEDLENLDNKVIKNKIIDKNLYYLLFSPKNLFEEFPITQWNKYYSNDENYLLDTQKNIENFNINDYNFTLNDASSNIDNILENYDNILNTENFVDDYDYINLPYVNKFNNNPLVMQFWCSYNFISPVITLIIPIISLILPFFIIKIQGYEITLKNYIEHLKDLLKNHALGSLFTDFKNVSFSSGIYIIITFILYGFQIYSNIFSCKRYYKNCNYIIDTLYNLKDYLIQTIKNMKNYSENIENLITYNHFNNKLKENIEILENFSNKISIIIDNKINKNLIKIGNIMTDFYNLYNKKTLVESLYYSFDFNGYLKNLSNIKHLIQNKKLNKCSFNDEKTYMINSYYIGLSKNNNKDDNNKDDNIIKNDISLNKNILISGPNASGKTTILKSTLFNIILSQQIGYGFYKKANVKIYDYIHCYINIPDTNDRDSLFQAEARKCKKILDCIEENDKSQHFCIFDEIFSGTNPDDAVNSGINYLNYLNKLENVDYMLTTHYYDLCKKSDKEYVKNLKMNVNKKSKDNMKFSYKIEEGINKINGGSKILKDLEFPDEIVKNDNKNKDE